ncbi:efflux RND transporter permease subunit [Parahaliea sp. F7430]|uniref:Efflux RND transporter permease subunit n=1 Tax=Sediminihaliea albiluteola TaxID=2758564 RepID=A0A7W2TXR2_9GAMM|nr:efflux RND transporter permease subunit [Sediminihaliea albiluteola]MBA6413896.1 efflux RND transporter permease subunit [Sediminihaliea albiluteola]
MKFTDIFINKPVLATVVSLFLVVLGLRAASELNVREYPMIQTAVITVSTAYIGADAELIRGFITTPLEQEIATAEGIDYITSNSTRGMSIITANVRSDANADEVLTQVVTKVNKLRNQLPRESEDPVINLAVGEQVGSMYISFTSDELPINRVADYVIREVEPKLSTLPGVQSAKAETNAIFAMRIWLDQERMTALNVTASDVRAALLANNVLSAVGASKGSMIQIDLKANTDISSIESFEQLVLREQGGAIVRLGDIAEVELGNEGYDTSSMFIDEEAVFVQIDVATDANALEVIAGVRKVYSEMIEPRLPEGIKGDINYDATVYIQNAIDDVQATIIEAMIIVIVVIFLFLGSMRSVLIPAVAVPLSLIGGLFLMQLMGFSINLLTLLAIVLAIGIVVDDAIIVLENIHRHIEHGMSPRDASIKGARELAWPIVAMTTTLIAVYIPIGFVGGLTGTLFTEFAFTLAGAVLISGVVALTLSPMMCAKLLSKDSAENGSRLEHWLDQRFEALRGVYQRDINRVLDDRTGILVFGAIVIASCYFLFLRAPSELAPPEDLGLIFYLAEGDPYVTREYMEMYTAEIGQITRDTPEISVNFLFNGTSPDGPGSNNGAFGGYIFEPWAERERSAAQTLEETIMPRAQAIAGLQMNAINPPPLPSSGVFPVEFVINTTLDFPLLYESAERVLQKARESGRFIFIKQNLQIDKPREQLHIDRDKAALLGVDMQTLSADLGSLLSGGFVNRFTMSDRSYKVIPQIRRDQRLNPDDLNNYYTRTRSGKLIPLSTLVTLEQEVVPRSLKGFQQLNAVTLSALPRPGVALGDALQTLEKIASEELTRDYSIDYAGQSRQFKTEGSSLLVTFFFALLLIYLVLAAQFESFRDPIIMLVTVPMSISGALLCLNFLSMFQVTGATLNIYTQVGLVTLIGVISKHGILIVEFANRLQEEGKSKREAIEEAASVRLRPVLMTTAALVIAMLPLLTASGPGASARFSMGLVIASGMTIGTLFTLYVLPAVYMFLGRDLQARRARAQEMAAAAQQS